MNRWFSNKPVRKSKKAMEISRMIQVRPSVIDAKACMHALLYDQ